MSRFQKGHILPEEQELKRRQNLKGRIPWNKGKKTSPETIEKMRLFAKTHFNSGRFKKGHPPFNTGRSYFKKGEISGSNHPQWKGGWRNFLPKCQDCNEQLASYYSNLCKRCSHKGQRSYNWKGGIAPLSEKIRKITEYKNWSKNILERDNFTCQKCNKKGCFLHAHHNKKSFSVIFQEFLQQYSQFSPIEDKETLERLAISYEPFWDLSNGTTLCTKCHYEMKRHKYAY